MNICISKFVIIPPKKQFVKIRQIEADSDSDGDEKHTCSRLQKYSIALVRCMSIILSCSSKIYIFVFMFFRLKKWNIYVNAIWTSAKPSRFSPVAVWLIKHRPVPGRASADLLSDFWKFLALVRHRTMPGRATLESYDINIKQKSSRARPMWLNP